MKKIIWIVFLAGLLALMFSLSVTKTSVEIVRAETITNIIPEDILSRDQRVWLGALEWCESKGNPEAINPNDRDNTPSYGLLQFKPGTLLYFQNKYKLTGKLMDPEAQEAIVEQMIIRGGINWSQQFPDCTKKLGRPPVIHKKD